MIALKTLLQQRLLGGAHMDLAPILTRTAAIPKNRVAGIV